MEVDINENPVWRKDILEDILSNFESYQRSYNLPSEKSDFVKELLLVKSGRPNLRGDLKRIAFLDIKERGQFLGSITIVKWHGQNEVDIYILSNHRNKKLGKEAFNKFINEYQVYKYLTATVRKENDYIEAIEKILLEAGFVLSEDDIDKKSFYFERK